MYAIRSYYVDDAERDGLDLTGGAREVQGLV